METAQTTRNESIEQQNAMLKQTDEHLYKAISTLIAGHNAGLRTKQSEYLQERIKEMRREIFETLAYGTTDEA